MNEALKQDIRRNFGRNLFTARQHADMTQEALAQELKIAHTVICRYEISGGNPNLVRLIELAAILECPVEDLIPIIPKSI